jgi:tetratricopeptide (TPR) repeat protein
VLQKTIALSAALVITLAAAAQPKKQVTTSAKSNPHIKAFELAITSGDATTATTALTYYLAEKGPDNAYADTLAMIYMQQGAFQQCYYWADKRLAIKKEDNTLLELKGICLDKMNQPKEAIDIFEKLFGKTQSPYHAYKLMEMQYGIKRLAECLATAQAAEKLTYKPDYLMTYNVGQQTGRTYLQAGVYNIHALALYDLDKKAEAKTYFEKALALDSSFALAKQNLEAMLSLETGDKKVEQGTAQPVVSPANKQN